MARRTARAVGTSSYLAERRYAMESCGGGHLWHATLGNRGTTQGHRITPKTASNEKIDPLSGRYLPLDMEGESVR
jgi:hypothetical protein